MDEREAAEAVVPRPPTRDYSQLLKDALVELKHLRTSLDEVRRAQHEAIAIVGAGCRLPGGVGGPEAYWRLLHDGVDAIGPVPPDRWDHDAYFDPNPGAPGKMSTAFGGFLEKIDEFDPVFFGISPREAQSLDPQQRLLLEVSWEAIERSGQSPAQLYGSSTGVFIGMSTFDYALHQIGGAVAQADLDRIDGYVATGATLSPAAGRLSYVLGLTGPSMVIDTACSSSLVATHLAISSLRAGECDLALVGGVNLILRPEWNVNFSKAGMMAPDGRCKTFDAAANGYVRGEGAAVLLLQRVSDALAQRRPIIALLKGSAVNQDGASGGLTVPNGPAQERVIRRAVDAAGIAPLDVSYVEAHGTGTSLGDPIEVAALGAVFGPGRSKEQPLRIASVKTNIGHLEAAAGVAGLLKVALALQRGEIPPHLHFTQPNPLIDWDGLPVAVPVSATPWPATERPRRAGISSFGFTGTNAHVVLEEAPRPSSPADSGRSEAAGLAERPVHVLTVSGRTADALREQAGRYARHLAEHPGLALADVAFTANTSRSHFRHRLAVVGDSLTEAQGRLAASAAGLAQPGVFAGQGADRPRLTFLFTGQGSQYIGMGRQLYGTQPAFRAVLDRCDDLLRHQRQASLLEVLYGGPDADPRLLDRTAYTQPALFALECALVEMWRSWGVEPDAVMGHSVGEYAAAYAAGIFSLEDGLTLVAERARLMDALPEAGQMVAVQAEEHVVLSAIAAHGPEVSVAAVNGPKSVVVSGPSQAAANVVAALGASGVRTQPLKVSHAFHSVLMEPMLREFERSCARATFGAPRVRIVSNVTGVVAGDEMATAAYWVRHAREPVRFARGMSALDEIGGRVFVEIGPSSTLLALGQECAPQSAAAWLPSLRPNREWEQVAHTLAELYARGVTVNWAAFDGHPARRFVELPTYPFQRQRCWIDVQRPAVIDPAGDAGRTGAHQAAPRSPANAEADVHGLLYRVEWVQRRPSNAQVPNDRAGHWVVLADGGPLGAALARQLRARGARCTIARAGDGYAAVDTDLYQVNPGEPAELERLYAAVSATHGPPQGVIHLWSLESTAMDASQAHDAGLESALHLVRLIARANGKPRPAIWCVTRAALSLGASAGTALALRQAPLWGLGRVAALEIPETWGGLLDLDANGDVDADADALAQDFLMPDGEDQIAIRGGIQHVPRLVRRTALKETKVALNPSGAYIVAGGLGALGLHAARWLVSRGARTLILASRRGLDTPGAREAVQDLERLGASEVRVLKADISVAEDVERLLALASSSSSPVRGVVHAAGVDTRVPLARMTASDLRAALESKVKGAWLLHDKTRPLELDLFVCFSSISSVLGAPERAHYAAANAFLDALAHERHRLGLAALSVNWGPWRDGGMASDEELGRLEQLGNAGLAPSVALRALDVLLDGGDVQATVIDADWSRLRPNFEARRPHPLLSELGSPAPGERPSSVVAADWRERLRAAPRHQRLSILETLLRAEVADVLGFRRPEEVPIDRSIFELGMDSFRAVQLTLRLQQHLELAQSIPFVDSPDVGALAARLLAAIEALESAATLPSDTADVQGLTTYAPAREPEIFEFSREAWPTRPQHLVEPRWRWMFVESARRLGQEPRVWLFREAGRIVAHHGAMPVRLKVGRDEIDSGWFADTMVLESHRKTATGTQLLVESNTVFPVALSLGQTSEMRKIALQLGWKQVAAQQTLLMILRPSRVFRDKMHPVLAGMAGAALSARSFAKRQMAGSADSNLEVRAVDAFDERHDRLWDAVKDGYECAVRRDASYLNWKYVTQPGQDFIRLEWRRADGVCAVAVLAIDDPGSIYKYRRALIVDLVVSAGDSGLVWGVLDAIRRHCVALSVDAIVFHLINDALVAQAQAYGFMPRDPSRFLLVNPAGASPEMRDALLSPARWLVTMGDSDIDRPWDVLGEQVQPRSHRPNGG